MRELMAIFGVWTLQSVVVFAIVAPGCAANTAEQYVRGGLDAIADVVGPSSKLAHEACDNREEVIASAAEKGTLSVEDAKAAVAAVRQRCDALWATFDRIREAHDQAASLVESGSIEKAKAEIEKARTLFRGLDLEDE